MNNKKEVPKSFSVLMSNGVIILKRGHFPEIKFKGGDYVDSLISCYDLFGHLPNKTFILVDEDAEA